jgi:hypothetical protein
MFGVCLPDLCDIFTVCLKVRFVCKRGWLETIVGKSSLKFHASLQLGFKVPIRLKVHKRENIFGSDVEFFTIFAFNMFKNLNFLRKNLIWPFARKIKNFRAY